MNEEQAWDTVLSVEQTWGIELGEDRQIWADAMLSFDSLSAAAAILKVRDRQRDKPTIADIRRVIIEIDSAQLAGSRPTREEGLEDQYVLDLQAWIKGWAVSRYKHGDMRVWPEQRLGYDSIQRYNSGHRTYVWPDQEKMPEEQMAEYTAEGLRLSVDDVFGLIGEAR